MRGTDAGADGGTIPVCGCFPHSLAPAVSDGGRGAFSRSKHAHWKEEEIKQLAARATEIGIKRAAYEANIPERTARAVMWRNGYKPVVVWMRRSAAPAKRRAPSDSGEYLQMALSGMSYRQMAQAKGVSIGTVARRMQVARAEWQP